MPSPVSGLPGITFRAGVPMLTSVRSPVLDMELNTRVPSLGPYVLKGGGAFEIIVQPGPFLTTELRPTYSGLASATARLGQLLDVRA